MNPVLEAWNNADVVEATDAMLACCGARSWAAQMVAPASHLNHRRAKRSSRSRVGGDERI